MGRDDTGYRWSLVPEKTLWYAIDFDWADSEWEISAMEDSGTILTMLGTQNRVQEIECLDPDTTK